MAYSSDKNIRVLMLHGYAQNSSLFIRKTQPLVDELRARLARTYAVPPSEIDFICPDAPTALCPSSLSTSTIYTIPDEGSSSSHSHLAWSRNLDIDNEYPGLDTAFSLLKTLANQHKFFHGIIGFSQGAALAAMYASWCESPNPLSVPSTPNNPYLHSILSRCAPQPRPLDFAILFSGFRGTARWYDGFYTQKLRTPSVHVHGRFDTMISVAQMAELVDAFEGSVGVRIVRHRGAHFMPRDRRVIGEVCDALVEVMHVVNTTTTTTKR